MENCHNRLLPSRHEGTADEYCRLHNTHVMYWEGMPTWHVYWLSCSDLPKAAKYGTNHSCFYKVCQSNCDIEHRDLSHSLTQATLR